MRFLASIVTPVALIRIAQVLHEMKYTCLDRPTLFTPEYLQGFCFRSGAWVFLCAVVLAFLIGKLRTKILVPTVFGLAVALWSLTFRVTPEHRDWEELWFGLYLFAVTVGPLIIGAIALLDRRKKAQPTSPGDVATRAAPEK